MTPPSWSGKKDEPNLRLVGRDCRKESQEKGKQTGGTRGGWRTGEGGEEELGKRGWVNLTSGVDWLYYGLGIFCCWLSHIRFRPKMCLK